MSYKVTEAPTLQVLSLQDAKAHLYVTQTADDAYITDLIDEAADYAERHMAVALRDQEITAYLSATTSAQRLPVGNVSGIESVAYRNTDNEWTAFTASDYYFDDASELIEIDEIPNNAVQVRVVYRAGYEYADDIPSGIIRGIKLLIGHWYANRESVVVGAPANNVPLAVDALLQQHRLMGV